MLKVAVSEVRMWIPTPGVKVYLGLGDTDMRKSIDSLGILVSEHLKQNVLSGHLFVFCNRRRLPESLPRVEVVHDLPKKEKSQ